MALRHPIAPWLHPRQFLLETIPLGDMHQLQFLKGRQELASLRGIVLTPRKFEDDLLLPNDMSAALRHMLLR
ncbi:hypothetical protein CCGE525_32300 (plasmid) [Rhizobium jaguaris]|uniref:Uncharacterized protein n=1 Tax=Rhizobium jaguaris TaxID=1312183 RepID=A0A387G0H5_9HYPH|nr:hypothetical protein CCGE525_32300 [Rhizobium jaguaris]